MRMQHTRNPGFIVVEGYDGSGKSTLLEGIRAGLPDRTFSLVGRKAGPRLADLAAVLEADERHAPESEMLVRLAVEFERTHLIEAAREEGDRVACDRGIVSAVSWFDYLGVARSPFSGLVDDLEDYHRAALTLVCRADFDTCWERSSQRPPEAQSRKDRLGRAVNARYFEQYDANVVAYAASGADVVVIDTASQDIATATETAIAAITARSL